MRNNEMPSQEEARINRNFDPDNSFYDRESDENFEAPQEAVSSDDEEDEDMLPPETESSVDIGRASRKRLQRNVEVVQEDTRSQRLARRTRKEESKSRRPMRTLREESDESAGSSSSDNEDDFEMSDINDGPRTRQQRNGQSKKKHRLPSSDDESEYPVRRSNRNQR